VTEQDSSHDEGRARLLQALNDPDAPVAPARRPTTKATPIKAAAAPTPVVDARVLTSREDHSELVPLIADLAGAVARLGGEQQILTSEISRIANAAEILRDRQSAIATALTELGRRLGRQADETEKQFMLLNERIDEEAQMLARAASMSASAGPLVASEPSELVRRIAELQVQLADRQRELADDVEALRHHAGVAAEPRSAGESS
jgi:hypothetical protein